MLHLCYRRKRGNVGDTLLQFSGNASNDDSKLVKQTTGQVMDEYLKRTHTVDCDLDDEVCNIWDVLTAEEIEELNL